MFGIRRLKTRLLVSYAQAMSAAQHLEYGLVTSDWMVSVLSEKNQQRVRRLIKGPVQSSSMSKTAEKLFDTSKVNQSNGFYQELIDLIEQRNRFAHNFFIEHAEKLTSKQHLLELIRKLQKFRKRCLLLNQVIVQAHCDTVLFLAESLAELQRTQEQRKKELWRSILEDFDFPQQHKPS
jgi:hypothetical protein